MNKLIFKLFYCIRTFDAILLLFVVILTGCGITGKTAGMQSETVRNPEVYFCPRDDCGKILESHINSANYSVHCAIYDINLKNVINALSKKSKSIDVKVVMDSSNQEGQIKGQGIRLDNNEQLMHNKFCVFDGNSVITGSFNPTDNDNYHNNNNALVVYSRAIGENYEAEFGELWDGKFGKGGNVRHPVVYINGIEMENYFCPEDKCASRITDLIKNAEKSAYFMSFSFTSDEIAEALIKKKGLDIRGIFDSSRSSNKFSQFKRLNESGIIVKKDSGKYKMHHKVFIIDNQTVVTGSFNPTLSADTKNDENILIIHDKNITGLFLKEFDSLWK